MSNESCASENATANTTNASDAPDTMSEGARILIEAMKTNPEHFEPGNKYHWVVQQLTGLRTGHGMSTRDYAVLKAAYDRYVIEPIFTESVIKTTLGVEDEEADPRIYPQGLTQAMTLNSSGSLGIGTAIHSVSPSHLAFHTQGGVNKMTITAGGQLEIETPNGKRVL